ncbi:MAG: hypothetical protein AB2604_05480, partial [Candidatus Thiodiazotropha taylori]
MERLLAMPTMRKRLSCKKPMENSLLASLFSNLLTRQPNSSLSAALSLPAARHQNAAVVLLQQVLITMSAGRLKAACLYSSNR